jgi:Polyketide cyclase / dehydrase and lipid transport
MIIPILIGIAVLAVLFVIIVATRPSDFLLTRSATIDAPPPTTFGCVNDFHDWEAWSPWAKLDPAVKNTYSGAASGVGASFSWSGNSKVGQGRMTITESRPDELIRIKLEFEKPFKATNQAEFAFKAEGDKTRVTWSMSGRNNFICKAMGLFMSFDKMIGGQFEKGLSQLNTVAAAAAKSEHAVA